MIFKSKLVLTIVCSSWMWPIVAASGLACSRPRVPKHSRVVDIIKPSETEEAFPSGTVANFKCDPGYKSFGSNKTICSDGNWLQEGIECLLEVAKKNNCYISSQADDFKSAEFAADGNPDTCVAFKSSSTHHIWSVDTFQAHKIRMVSILSEGPLSNSTIEIRVGSHFPSTGAGFNKLCTRQNLENVQQNNLLFYCDGDAPEGRYISVSIVEPGVDEVSFCEVGVFTDSSLAVQDACILRPMSKAQYVFENQCVHFVGEHSHSAAQKLCEQRGGVLAKPLSRAFQAFLDFNIRRLVEDSTDEYVLSYWIDAKRSSSSSSNNTDAWADSTGAGINNLQIENNHSGGDCLVSNERLWREVQCRSKNHVICVSPPKSCGTPGLSEHASAWNRTELAVNRSITFTCSTDNDQNSITLQCYPNGTLSPETVCVRPPASTTSLLHQVTSWLQSVQMFTDLSAWQFKLIVIAFSAFLSILLSAILFFCFCMLKRHRNKKISKETHWSLMSFSVHMRDLPIANSSRLFKTPVSNQNLLTVPKV